MTYQINEQIHGFTFTNSRPLPHEDGRLYELTHDVTQAKLIYVQTKAANKLFSVAFKTIPKDDSGVFHILEHSLLSGSEKYPLREPFVELLKSSMNTYMNALTFPDKTMYPASSRNDKDYFNLMGVYLDAVFAPLAMKNPNIFYQEGWHYELKADMEQPVYKGVVFNEMKGAESNVDTQIRGQLKKMLYGESCYGYNSGGDVEKIPTLTYEAYTEMYRKYYHPGNAVFYLEGNLELEPALALIQSYLGKFDGPGETFKIPYVEAAPAAEKIAYYDIGEDDQAEEPKEEPEEESAEEPKDESEEESAEEPEEEPEEESAEEPEEEGTEADDQTPNPASDKIHTRTQITYAKLYGTYLDRNQSLAIELLDDYLTGSNEAPLTQAVLTAGLAEDFSIGLQDGIKQPYFQISVTNCDYEKKQEIHDLIFDTVKKLAAEGLSRHDLNASLNEMEFQYREETEPKALYRNIRVLDTAMYGSDPMLYLDCDDVFTFLREMLDTDYYEKLLLDLFDEEHMQTVYMLPSTEIGEKKRKAEEARLAAISAAWTQEEREEVLELNRKLLTWQQTPDTPEAFAAIPKLTLADVDPDPEQHKLEVSTHRGATILHHGEGTNGIVYLNLYFPIKTRDPEILQNLTLLPSMLGGLSTAAHSALEFQTDCQEHLGDMSYDIVTEAEPGNLETCQIYFEISAACLKKEVPEALRLMKEVLHTTRFDEVDLIRQKLQQKQESARRSIISNGHNYALSYMASADSALSAADEALSGLTSYWYLKELNENFEEKKDRLLNIFRKAQENLFRIPTAPETPAAGSVYLSITANESLEEIIDLDAWLDAFAEEGVTAATPEITTVATETTTAATETTTAATEITTAATEIVTTASESTADATEAASVPANPSTPADTRRKDIPARTAVIIPSGVSYAAARGNLVENGSEYSAKWRVLANILRFGYLWDEIRVQGGAYGTGSNFGSMQGAAFHTYRDPDPIRSLEVFTHADDFIRTYISEHDSLEAPIISAIAAMDPLLAPSEIGDHYDSLYMRGSTWDKRRDFRRKLCSLVPSDLQECADTLARMKENHRECVICHADAARKLKEKGFTIRTI